MCRCVPPTNASTSGHAGGTLTLRLSLPLPLPAPSTPAGPSRRLWLACGAVPRWATVGQRHPRQHFLQESHPVLNGILRLMLLRRLLLLLLLLWLLALLLLLEGVLAVVGVVVVMRWRRRRRKLPVASSTKLAESRWCRQLSRSEWPVRV